MSRGARPAASRLPPPQAARRRRRAGVAVTKFLQVPSQQLVRPPPAPAPALHRDRAGTRLGSRSLTCGVNFRSRSVASTGGPAGGARSADARSRDRSAHAAGPPGPRPTPARRRHRGRPRRPPAGADVLDLMLLGGIAGVRDVVHHIGARRPRAQHGHSDPGSEQLGRLAERLTHADHGELGGGVREVGGRDQARAGTPGTSPDPACRADHWCTR